MICNQSSIISCCLLFKYHKYGISYIECQIFQDVTFHIYGSPWLVVVNEPWYLWCFKFNPQHSKDCLFTFDFSVFCSLESRRNLFFASWARICSWVNKFSRWLRLASKRSELFIPECPASSNLVPWSPSTSPSGSRCTKPFRPSTSLVSIGTSCPTAKAATSRPWDLLARFSTRKIWFGRSSTRFVLLPSFSPNWHVSDQGIPCFRLRNWEGLTRPCFEPLNP